jgi:hypothetical protein
MLLTWFVGLWGLNSGYGAARFIHAGVMPDMASAALHAGTPADTVETAVLGQLQALLAHASVTFPLSVAEAILSALLAVASGLAMGGRRGMRSLALQAILANAALAVATYTLTPFLRTASLEGMLHAAAGLPADLPGKEILQDPRVHEWMWRVKLVLIDLGPLALGALALTRPRTRAYFDAVARATESAEEP